MSYFISTTDDSDLELDPEDFARSLAERWPGAAVDRVEPDAAGIHALRFTLLFGGMRVDGSLDESHQVVNLKGDVKGCAEVAIWLRDLVDIRYELVFFDEGFSASVNLTPASTPDEVAGAFIG